MHKMLPTVNPHPFHSENKEARLIHNSHIHSNDSQANCRIASHCCKVVGSILEKSSMVHAFFLSALLQIGSFSTKQFAISKVETRE